MKDDIKELFRENYLRYASYVILDRAIPNMVDGLKPVQRRILWTLFQMDDGKLHKVANASGQTMALHPHGDAPINEALVNLANKGYLLDTQGNFGNPLTGDPPAAARYIETRLSSLAKETLFNPELTHFLPSYDGRNQEPEVLPSKIPLLLMLGTEGIAVGMSTKILPHNFQELLKAEIAILENKPFKVFPDFPSGGMMDPSNYDKGRGKIKLRAKINIIDEKTLVISEICYGTTTESLIRSIDDAAKKGKIKIDSIHDYTAEKIEIEIKLPRGQYAKNTIDSLYAFTECEVTIHTQLLVIKENVPHETTVDDFLRQHVELLKGYLRKELEIRRDHLLEKIFEKTLEEIFIENRLYKKIENLAEYKKIHDTIEKSLVPFYKQLQRVPTYEDRERLLGIPIRRISRFDINKNREDILALEEKLYEVEQCLKDIKKYTIRYIQGILKKYGTLFPRKTQVEAIEELDKKEIAKKRVRIGYDPSTGYLGTKVTGPHVFECLNVDKLLVFYVEGTYIVCNIPEKEYIHTKESSVAWVGLADKATVMNALYKDKVTGFAYVKRFVVKQFILDKEYSFLEAGHKLEYLTSDSEEHLQLTLKSKGRQKKEKLKLSFEETAVRGAQARGIRVANKQLLSVKIIQKGQYDDESK